MVAMSLEASQSYFPTNGTIMATVQTSVIGATVGTFNTGS